MSMERISQRMRTLAPELDPLRLGTGWTREDLGKAQILIESTFGDSHPGSGHLDQLVEAVVKEAEKRRIKIDAICSYAEKWLSQHR